MDVGESRSWQKFPLERYALACKAIVGGATSERGGLFTDAARGHRASVTAGTLKDFQMSNCGDGGEGAICIR